jgi:hypothetical protein
LVGGDCFLEVGFCRGVFALGSGHHRLGALDVACEPQPVLAGADDLAATLKDEYSTFSASASAR